MTKKILITLLVVAIVSIPIISLPHIGFNFIFGKPSRSTKIPKYYVDTPHYKAAEPGKKYMKTIEHKDEYITSRDNLKLHAHFYPTEKSPKKFVIGVHGYKSYSRAEYAPYIEFYQSLGYSMLLPDDRAHEPSEGKYIGFGVLDRLDCVDWAKHLVEVYGDDIEILLHGVSMGGATVVAASGEKDLPKQVKGIVSDCGFTSAHDILVYQIKETAHLPVNYLLPKIEKICVEKAGFNFTEHTAIEQVKNSKVPMLFVHGEKDEMVPPNMAKELYDACPTDKRLLMVKEAAHGESIAFAKEEYESAIKELIEKGHV